MRCKEHIFFAILAGVVISYLLIRLNLLDIDSVATFSIWGIIIGAFLPDLLEPATNYMHRDFFHSKRMLKWLAFPIIPSFLLALLVPFFYWIFFLLIGYESHLLGDAITPMGLPE